MSLVLFTLQGVARAQELLAIPQSNFTLHGVDSQETVGENGAATNAFDGKSNTIWHTEWFNRVAPMPHWIEVNLGGVYDVTGFRYLPRQNSPNGRIGRYEFYLSSDGATWGTAVATGTFPNTSAEQQVQFTRKSGRFVRLVALSSAFGTSITSMAELNVLTTSNLPPNGEIQPAGNVTITPNASVDFSGTGSDPDGNLPLSYRWNFGNGMTSSLADPPPVPYVTSGVYTVTLTVTDALGAADPTPPTRTVTVQNAPPPATVIPQTNFTLHRVDSQETVGENGAATNAFDGRPTTIWHTEWFNRLAPLPHWIEINLGGFYAVSGFRYLPRQNSPNGRIANYEFYVSIDGSTWGTAVATGTFPNTTAQQQVSFTPKSGRFVRLVALSTAFGQSVTSAAEINVLTTSNLPPSGDIQPSGNVTVAPNIPVDFSGTAVDPDNTLPLTYSWNFGNGTTSTLLDPPAVTYATTGVYTVTFTVTDALGAADPTPAIRTVTVENPSSGLTLIPRTGWSVIFADSEETTAENGVASNALDGNTDSRWASRFFNGTGTPPPHEIQINLGALYSVAGFRYLPGQHTQNGRIGEYEFYVSNNPTAWGNPVAAGAFPDVNSGNEIEVLFPARTGQYVRLRAMTEVNGADQIYSAVAEVNVLREGSGANAAPVPTILSPTTNVTIPTGSALRLLGSGTDPDAHTPLTYRWSVSPGAGIADVLAADGGIVHFDRAGTYTSVFTVTDQLGKSTAVGRVINVVAGAAIPQGGWALVSVDSQETVGENGAAINAFDGNPSTIWHTQWFGGVAPLPHEIQINLGSMRDVSGFRYLPRQNSQNGRITDYEFYVSVDGVNWGPPLAAGTFPNTSTQQQVSFGVKRGQFVRFRALASVGGTQFSSVAELNVLERPCPGPSVRIVTPRSRSLQPSTTLNVRLDACLASPSDGMRLIVDGGPGSGGTQTDLYTSPYEVTLHSLAEREHVLEAILIDSAGAAVPGEATHDRADLVGIGDFLVAMGDGVTLGYSDDIPTDDNSSDGRTMWGGYTSILADALTDATNRPVTVVNAGVGGTSSNDGAASIAALLGKYPNAEYFLVNYGHNDFLHHNNSKAAFKQNIQSIINAARAAGKKVIVSKAAPVLNMGSEINARIQEYNQAMEELALDPLNGVPVLPPDFYGYFSSHTTEYANNFEMNGVGYQSMANIWRQALCPLLGCAP